MAAVFEDLPAEKLPVLFRLCPKDLAADVFTELAPETQQKLIDGLTDTELKAVVDELFVDDATDLVEEMPANVVKRILGQADPTTRRMINELLKYPEDSAGGVMTTELMELRPDMTVAQAMEAIRRNGFDKETINNCYVTDDSRRLIGVVSLRALVLAKNTEEPIKDLMDSNVVSVSTTTDQEDVSNLFEKYGFLAIPVVDAENRLVGIVTIDDAISILQDEASEDIAKDERHRPLRQALLQAEHVGPVQEPCAVAAVPDDQRHLLQSGHSRIRGRTGRRDRADCIHPHADRCRRQRGQPEHLHHHPRHGGGRYPAPRSAPHPVAREPRGPCCAAARWRYATLQKLLVFDRIAAPVALVVCLTLICTILLSQIIGGIPAGGGRKAACGPRP